MPQERNRFEPRDRVTQRPIGGIIPAGTPTTPTGPSGGPNSGFPADGSPVEEYPGLIWKGGLWFDPSNSQYYDPYSGNKISPDRIPAPVVTDDNGGERQGGVYRPAPDPGDGPVADPNAWLNGQDPYWYTQREPIGPNTYINNPGAPSGSGSGQLANPMPQMPQIGTQGVSPSQSWSRQARPGGQDTFRPWGQPISYMSQALRYGGPPNISEGIDPAMILAAQAAALRS